MLRVVICWWENTELEECKNENDWMFNDTPAQKLIGYCVSDKWYLQQQQKFNWQICMYVGS